MNKPATCSLCCYIIRLQETKLQAFSITYSINISETKSPHRNSLTAIVSIHSKNQLGNKRKMLPGILLMTPSFSREPSNMPVTYAEWSLTSFSNHPFMLHRTIRHLNPISIVPALWVKQTRLHRLVHANITRTLI